MPDRATAPSVWWAGSRPLSSSHRRYPACGWGPEPAPTNHVVCTTSHRCIGPKGARRSAHHGTRRTLVTAAGRAMRWITWKPSRTAKRIAGPRAIEPCRRPNPRRVAQFGVTVEHGCGKRIDLGVRIRVPQGGPVSVEGYAAEPEDSAAEVDLGCADAQQRAVWDLGFDRRRAAHMPSLSDSCSRRTVVGRYRSSDGLVLVAMHSAASVDRNALHSKARWPILVGTLQDGSART
jgi:hypothetical protein